MNYSLPASMPGLMNLVLIIDANREFCEMIESYLSEFGYAVNIAHTKADGLAQVLTQPFQAVILDTSLPDADGFDLLKRIRRSSAVPILILADRADEAIEVAGLECGADNFFVKNHSAQQLLARLHAITRRAASVSHRVDAPGNEIKVAELRIVPAARVVTLADRTLALTPSEYEILLSLVKAKGCVKTRDHLFAEICHCEYEVFDRRVDVLVSALRRKLGDDPHGRRFIHTVRSVGYMFSEPSQDAVRSMRRRSRGRGLTSRDRTRAESPV